MGELEVSVIIPAFNAAQYLSQAIDSVLLQQEVTFELIIIDNNSVDNTLELALGYQDEYPSLITVVSENTQGAAAARNKGLAVARGKFIQFLDADDVLLPRKLVRQCALCQDYDWLIGVNRIQPENGSVYEISPLEDPWKGLIAGRIGDMNANFFKRKAILKINGQDNEYKRGQDKDMYFRLLKNGCSCVCDYTPGAVYNTRSYPRLWQENEIELLTRVTQRHFEVIDFLRLQKPDYFAKNQAYFTSHVVVSLRQAATINLRLATQLFKEGFPEGVTADKLDPAILPYFTKAYSLVGFSLVERARLAIRKFLPGQLKEQLKNIGK